jgi:hypothetical protein
LPPAEAGCDTAVSARAGTATKVVSFNMGCLFVGSEPMTRNDLPHPHPPAAAGPNT